MSATNGKLSGEKLFVSDAAIADFIIVAARNGVFVVDSKARGLKISPMCAMDLTRKLYVVEFSNTPAEEIGAARISTGFRHRHRRSGCRIGRRHAADLDITVEYAKTRKQFGKPIGMFQAVQHQCADMYLETESSRSAVYYAGWALGEDSPDAALLFPSPRCMPRCGRTVGNVASRFMAAWVSPGKTIFTCSTVVRRHRKQHSEMPRSSRLFADGLESIPSGERRDETWHLRNAVSDAFARR